MYSFLDTEFKKQSGMSQVFFPYSFIFYIPFRFLFSYHNLPLLGKGDRAGVPRREFVSGGGSRVAVDEANLSPAIKR
jgi:hypothetical protein